MSLDCFSREHDKDFLVCKENHENEHFLLLPRVSSAAGRTKFAFQGAKYLTKFRTLSLRLTQALMALRPLWKSTVKLKQTPNLNKPLT